LRRDEDLARNLLYTNVSLLHFFHQGAIHEAFYAKGFYPDRIDDRGCDHWYFGGGGFARLPGLHRAGESL